MRWMTGGPAAVPSRIPRVAYMPTGKTTIHRSVRQRSGAHRTPLRAASGGNRQLAKAQNVTTRPVMPGI